MNDRRPTPAAAISTAARRAQPDLRTAPRPRTWDGRLARALVVPLVGTPVTPNHLTALRLVVGIVGAAFLAQPDDLRANIGAFLIVLSNFIDHTDGELARISGQSSPFGHAFDLAADAIVTVLLFAALGVGVAARGAPLPVSPAVSPIVLGIVAGTAVALIFFLRMRIEARAGKAEVAQSFAAGFETEDVLYLLPLVTLAGVTAPFVVAAAIGAPLFALWVTFDYHRVMRATVR